NPMPDNGIKFFARGGQKLPDSVEDQVEARMREEWQRPVGTAVGRVRDYAEGYETYHGHLLSTLPNTLDGLKLVVDCSHGAAARVAPEALRRAGAEVVSVG